MILIGLTILSYAIQPHVTTSTGYTKPYDNPSQPNLISSYIKVILHIHEPTWAYNHPFNLHQISIPLLQSIFTSLFHTYLFTKSSWKPLLVLPSSMPQQFLISLFLRTTIPKIYTKNIFSTSTFPPLRLHQGTRELGNLVRIDTVLISPFFLKVWRWEQRLQSLVPYLSGSWNWYIAGKSLYKDIRN